MCDGGALGMVNQDPCCNPNCEYKGSAICRCVFYVCLFVMLSLILTPLSHHSDVNDLCCQDCGYASNDTVCQEFGEGNRECRRDILCTYPPMPGFCYEINSS